jgi:CBS domain-containing protein
MEIIGTARRVTIYIGESDRHGGKPLYMAILELLKAENCAGATVTRGVAGFGAHSRIHTASIVDLSSDLPLVVEWIDDPARIDRLMPRLTALVVEGLITCDEVEVLAYGHRELRRLPVASPVSEVMSREVRTVTPDAPAAQAVEMLIGKAYRALPVIDAERRVVGILTDGDLLARLQLPNARVQMELTEAELSRELAALAGSGQTVADLMVSPAVTTFADAAIGDAVRVMTERGIKRLPVVDRDGKLVGMVSRVDVLRALAQPPVAETAEHVPLPGSHRVVREVMLAGAPTVPADTPLSQVVDHLVIAAERRVVVVDAQQHALGIITDGDLLRRAAAGERAGLLQAFTGRGSGGQQAGLDLGKRKAAEVMTSPVITVTPDTPLLDALRLLLQRKIKRLPVVDEQGRVVGIVGRGDILHALAQELPPA